MIMMMMMNTMMRQIMSTDEATNRMVSPSPLGEVLGLFYNFRQHVTTFCYVQERTSCMIPVCFVA